MTGTKRGDATVPAPLDPRASIFDTDVLFRDHGVDLICIRSVRSAQIEGSSLVLQCRTVRIHRTMRDRYGTILEIADPVGDGPDATVRFDALSPSTIRMRMSPGDDVPANATPMIETPLPADTTARIAENAESWLITTVDAEVEIWRDPFRYIVRTRNGAVLRETIPAAVYQRPPTGESHIDGAALSDAWPWFFRDLAPLGFMHDPRTDSWQAFETAFLGQDEHLYGFGERFGAIDKRGQAIHLWHANPAGKTWPLSYKNVPFYLSTLGYGHFTNSSRPITYHCGDLSHVHQSVHVHDSFLDTYLFVGPDLRDVLDRYTMLTGRPHVPPTWSFGLWMSRMSYREQSEIEGIASRLRDERIPIDVIHVDTDWFATEWVNDLEFSPERFPDPRGMLERLREKGMRLTLWQIPYISVHSRFFEVFERNGWFARQADGSPRLIDGFFGPAGVIDFTNPDAARWYVDKLEPLFDMGVAAIKTDFGEGAPVDALYHAGDGLDVHNLYPLEYNKAVFDKTLAYTGEPIIWGRSAYAGSQRYSVYWGGDPAARWQDLGQLLSGGLGLGLCGFPYWSQDIGGFAGTPSPELYIRWAEFGMFMTHPRAHGPIAREPWVFGDEAVDVFRYYAALRYQLLPYVVSESWQLAPQGQPLMRPMLLDNQDDPSTWHISDQFMFGRELLVAPVVQEDATNRRVYLPRGNWIHWDHRSGGAHATYRGPGWVTVDAPLDDLPMFLPNGAVLPLVEPVQHTGEITYDHLTIHVVSGRGRSAAFSVPDAPRIEVSLETDPSTGRLTTVSLTGAPAITLVIHGLPSHPARISADSGNDLTWMSLPGGSIQLECPAGTGTVTIADQG